MEYTQEEINKYMDEAEDELNKEYWIGFKHGYHSAITEINKMLSDVKAPLIKFRIKE